MPAERSSVELSLQDSYRAASLAARAIELAYLDDARNIALADVRGRQDDMLDLETLTDMIKERLFECAESADWVRWVTDRHPVASDMLEVQLRVFATSMDGRTRDTMLAILDRGRLSRMVQLVPEQVMAAARDLEVQMIELRGQRDTPGDISRTGRCATYGLAAALGIGSGLLFVAMVAAFAIGVECVGIA
jgi:hypothetical protein